MGYIITIIVVIVLFNTITEMIRTQGWYEVIDQNNQSRTIGKYDECRSWIKAQKGMDSLTRHLTGQKNRYKIRKYKP